MRYVKFDTTDTRENYCRMKTTRRIALKFFTDFFETNICWPMQKAQNLKKNFEKVG